MILALAIGLWGVGTLSVSYVILKNDLNENFLRTSPYHVALNSKQFSKLDITQFRQWPEIESAEFRDLAFLRIEAFPNQWLPLWLYGVKNFENFQLARIYPQRCPIKPQPNSILMERNGLLVSNLDMGSTAPIRVGSEVKRVPLSGIVFDPAQAPATQDAFIYAYTDQASFKHLTGNAVNERLIIRLKNAENRAEVIEQTHHLTNKLKELGIEIDRIDIPNPNEHPHQWQLNTLIALQGLIGALALVMGSILVSQLISSIVTGQTRQIGILKAVGANRLHIFSLYLLMVLLMGILSSAIAIPLAIGSGFGFAGFVSKILNFDILTTTLPNHLYLILIGFGLLLPALFALPSLLRGSRLPIQVALSDYGLSNQQPSYARLKLPGLNSFGFLVASRNVFRRRQRLATMVASIALGVAIFCSGFNVRQSLLDFLDQTQQSIRYDVQIVLKNSVTREHALIPFSGMNQIERTETWNGGRGRLQSKVASAGSGIGIVALPYNTDLVTPDIISGRWIQPSRELEMVMNQKAADRFGEPVEVGKRYTFKLGQVPVEALLVGITKEFDVAKIYMDKSQYDSITNPNHLINSILFIAKDRSYESVNQLKQDIEERAAKSDLDIFYVMSQAERAKVIYDHLNIILTLFTLLSSLVLIISVLGMAATTGTNIMERTREIGVMRAIGATPKLIFRLFEMEGAIVSSMGILLGFLLSLPLSLYASKFFGTLILGHDISLDFAFSAKGFIVTLMVTLAFGWLASRIPARRAVSISNRDALLYE